MAPSPDPGARPAHSPRHDPASIDGDAAVDLLIANTAPGQTVLDLDADPILRAAAQTTGRRYRTLTANRPTSPRAADETAKADLVVLTWPRPHSPAASGGRADLAAASARLAPGGHVALLLEPTIAQPYTITWTGTLLAAARDAGLDYLQDVVCLHSVADTAAGRLIRHHRVVLILRTQAGRHA